MKPYPKIQSVFKRPSGTRKAQPFLIGEWTLPEFEYLANNLWWGQEKINGENVRIHWNGEEVIISGKTDDAQIVPSLLNTLQNMFTPDLFDGYSNPMTLYGEGYGQNVHGGEKYLSNSNDFILFDVKIDEWWLEKRNVQDIGKKLGLKVVPILFAGNLDEALTLVEIGFQSTLGDILAEGLVLRPIVDLFTRKGERIITKIKYTDFKR